MHHFLIIILKLNITYIISYMFFTCFSSQVLCVYYKAGIFEKSSEFIIGVVFDCYRRYIVGLLITHYLH